MGLGWGSPSISALKAATVSLVAATLVVLAAFLALVVLHALSPTALLLAAAELSGMVLILTALVAFAFGTLYAVVRYPSMRVAILFLALLTTATLAAHIYIINNPSLPACRDTSKNVNGCIMDEVYYVPTAENMLNGTQCGPTVPYCNTEHPFLSKALISAGIAVFGDNSFGWRIFNVLLGTFSLPLLFALVYKVSGDKRPAYLASALLGLDIMFFTQSSAALIDIPGVFFGLLAFVAYAYDVKAWVLDRYVISGVFLGLSVLSKETGVFFVLALATFHLLTHKGRAPKEGRISHLFARVSRSLDLMTVGRTIGIAMIAALIGLVVIMTGMAPGITVSSPFYLFLEILGVGFGIPFFFIETVLVFHDHPAAAPTFASAAEIVVVSAVVFILGLQAYDSLFAQQAFPTFVAQLKYMLSYGSSLIGPGWTYGNNIQITPFSWMTYYKPVTYYGTQVSVCTDLVNNVCQSAELTYPGVAYYGVTNLIETWTVYLWFPLAAVIAWKSFGPVRQGLEEFGFVDPTGRHLAPDQRLAILSLVWFSWNYFPYIFLFAVGRVTYPFYVIPALPAVAMGASYFLTRKWVPKPALILYLAGVFLMFFIFFPSKEFLPQWLRAFIGR